MKKLIIAGLAVAGLGLLAPAHADEVVRVDDPTPNGVFTDGEGNQGYVSVDDEGIVRACNENDATPAGDSANGYVYVNANGDETDSATYGNGYVGAEDSDGSSDGNPANGNENNDCP
jgi:hypothetical protein